MASVATWRDMPTLGGGRMKIGNRKQETGDGKNVARKMENGKWRNFDLEQKRKRWLEVKAKYERGEISQEAYWQAKVNYETAQILAGEKRRQIMAQKSGLTAAALAVQRAELNLSYTEIRAPFSGYVADLKIEQGQQVTAGQECLRLVDLSQIEVE